MISVPAVSGDGNRLIGRVRSEVMALNQIIDDFLAFARPHRTERELHDVLMPINEAIELARAEAARNAIDHEVVHAELASGAVALADPYQVKRLTLNLIRNGLQAGGEVWVSTEVDHGQVVIIVRDNGPGVAPELRDHIFEPFVTDREQGVGLGLAIVQELASANGGRIELVPDEKRMFEEGAEFRVYLRGAEDLPAESAATTPSA